MRIVPLILVSCLLGCSHADLHEAIATARQDHYDAIQTCEIAHPDEHKKPVTPRVTCINDANMRFATRVDPNQDLVRTMSTKMLVAAEQFDNGAINEARYDAERAALYSDYKNSAAQRKNSKTMADAAKSQAAAVWSMSIPKSVHCTEIGGSVWCY